MVKTDLTLDEFSAICNKLARKDAIYESEVPEFLLPDLNKFLVGKTLSSNADGQTIIYDFSAYWKNIYLQTGLPFQVQFKTDPL